MYIYIYIHVYPLELSRQATAVTPGGWRPPQAIYDITNYDYHYYCYYMLYDN